MPYVDPSWKTVGDPLILQYERNFVAGDLICGIGYGMQTLLFGACLRDLWARKHTRTAKVLMAYISFLYVVETMFVVVQANTVQLLYVDYRGYPGGPWEFFLHTQDWPVNVMFYATLFILTFMNDLLVLWRCWVIWTASGKKLAYAVAAFPAISLLASFVVGTLWTLQSSKPGLSFYSKLPMAYGTSYYAVSLGVNILLTFLIILRLVIYRRSIQDILPAEYAKHYTSIATIVIESALLYSLCALCFLITYALNNPANQIWLGIASAAQQIAGYLIILRLASGKAWNKNTLKPGTVSTMSFQPSPHKSGSATITNISTFRANPPPGHDSMMDEDSVDATKKDGVKEVKRVENLEKDVAF